MSTCPFNPADDGAQTASGGRMSYGDYLFIDQILGAQATLTTAHDEMLFIIQHQTSELWMRLAPQAFRMLSRVARIFEQLMGAWDVLHIMTPANDTHFRDDLGQSSGFQSRQYRLIEYPLATATLPCVPPMPTALISRANLMQNWPAPAFMVKPCACWPAKACPCPPKP